MRRSLSSFSLGRVFTLSTKLITLMSLVILLGSIFLGLYFIEMQIRYQTKSLMNTGQLLAQNLAHNGRYHLFLKDEFGLNQLIDGAFPVQEVVYVVFSDSSGQILAAQSKGTLSSQDSLSRSATTPLYADAGLRQKILARPSPGVTITPFSQSSTGEERVSANHGKAGMVLATFSTELVETLFDFSVPILRSVPQPAFDPLLSFELRPDSGSQTLQGEVGAPVQGLIQIGLSDASLQQEVHNLVWQGILITCFIVVVGLVVTALVARRMTVPLKALTQQAIMIPKGNLSFLPSSNAEDEIGQLTTSFNHMIQALRQEKHTVEQQISRLTTIHTVGTSISSLSSSSLDALLSTALQQLIDHSEFHCAALGLYDDQRHMLSSIHGSGLPSLLMEKIAGREFPVDEHGGVLARVLIHHHSVVAHDLSMLSTPSDIPLIESLESHGITSFIIVPLESDQHIL
ncbi:MAG: HAMP domain-containing protein [Nitrospirae bacterium]|nr:HAMP domain-containing protein [Nitrospirota bacterium]MDA1304607.1 HAMP domain-containing protein [Nitrospirota bacterium]